MKKTNKTNKANITNQTVSENDYQNFLF